MEKGYQKKAGRKLSALACVILVISLMVTLTACRTREPVTSDVFKEKAEDLGYTVSNITDQYAQYTYILKCVGFETDSIHMEFFEIDSSDNAVSFFDANKTQVETYKSSGTTETSVSVNSYQKYTLKTQEKYYIVVQVGTTAIYSYCDKSESEQLDNLIKAIDY